MIEHPPRVTLSEAEYTALVKAKKVLENPSFAIKASNYIGKPVEFAIEKIDSKMLNEATSKALRKSLDIAVSTIDTQTETTASSNLLHKTLVVGSGAVGGFFGLAALALELPVSTTIMLRSIADIAQSQEHDLSNMAIRLSCLEVFALGSNKSDSDNAAESAYYSTRATLAIEMKAALKAVEKMSTQAIQDALKRGQMPLLIKFIGTIASRFGMTVSEKLVAQAIPVLGAAGGAAINLMFIQHFQDMAEGHFTVKRLENKYGEASIEKIYNKIVIN